MNSPFHIYQLSIHFLPFCSYTNTETLYIITKTPGGFPCLYKGFACGYRAALCTHLFHLPERAGHSPDKAPLALHIGFQIFRALPVCLLDCFLLLRQKTVPAKVKASSKLYHRNYLFFTQWHETTIFRE